MQAEFLSKDLLRAAYPDRRFQLVDPATELKNDGHRSMTPHSTVMLGLTCLDKFVKVSILTILVRNTDGIDCVD